MKTSAILGLQSMQEKQVLVAWGQPFHKEKKVLAIKTNNTWGAYRAAQNTWQNNQKGVEELATSLCCFNRHLQNPY